MNEREIFLTAIEFTDLSTRQAYLDDACRGNGALRIQVERLLRSHDQGGTFLRTPAVIQMVAEPAEKSEATAFLGVGSTHKERRPTAGSPGSTMRLPSDTDDPQESDNDVDHALALLAPSTKPGSLGRLAHYEVLAVIGKGAFGTVLKAFDEMLHRMVAIKLMSVEMAATSPARKRFLREARASAAVRHDNVVNIYGVNEQPIPYLVMEYIPGQTLQQRLEEHGPFETLEALHLGQQIANGLAAAHAQGMIHRDVKPANILLDSEPEVRVKITDFGLARAADDASLSQSGLIAGTPMYMAPEQALGGHIDQRADLFSFGSVLYQMLSGRPPFRASTTIAVLKRVTEDTPRPIPEIIPEVPTWLCDIVSKLHAKQPEDRYQSAKEVADLLGQCLADLKQGRTPTVATPPASVSSQKGVLPDTTVETPLQSISSLGGKSASAYFTWIATVVATLLVCAGILVCAGMIARIRNGRVTEIRVPPGSTVELVSAESPSAKVTRVSSLLAVEWIERTQALPPEKQVEAVAAELERRNPGFDGQLVSVQRDNTVFRLEILCDHVFDLTPVRVLADLKELQCSGSTSGKGMLTDLSPVSHMSLRHLTCSSNQITDLKPLKGMQLTHLDCSFNPIADFSPVQKLPLDSLVLHGTNVTDLEQLKGLKLTTIGFDHTNVADLTPLADMPLKLVSCQATSVRDLAPLSKAPLDALNCIETKVADLTPLRSVQIRDLLCDFNPQRDTEILKSIKTLLTINGTPVAEFWKSAQPSP